MSKFRPNVALLLLNADDRLLVCERVKVRDSWQFPQGGVDKGESMLEALYREVEEEIGLPPESYEIIEQRDGYTYVFPEWVKKRKKGFEGQTQTYFLCRLKDDAPEIDVDQQSREFRAYRWIKPSKFDKHWLPEFKRDVYKAVLRDFFDVKL